MKQISIGQARSPRRRARWTTGTDGDLAVGRDGSALSSLVKLIIFHAARHRPDPSAGEQLDRFFDWPSWAAAAPSRGWVGRVPYSKEGALNQLVELIIFSRSRHRPDPSAGEKLGHWLQGPGWAAVAPSRGWVGRVSYYSGGTLS